MARLSVVDWAGRRAARPQRNNSAFDMSKLKKASARLEKAVDRLDAALETSQQRALQERLRAMEGALAAVERERDSLRADLENLKADQRRLNEALKDAQENYAAMQVVNEAVAGRLDNAIGELRTILEV